MLCAGGKVLLFTSTFSRWMSFLIWEILIFMASSSSSGTSGMLGTASASSTVWKLRSVSGMYHLQSYCWLFLEGRGDTTLRHLCSLSSWLVLLTYFSSAGHRVVSTDVAHSNLYHGSTVWLGLLLSNKAWKEPFPFQCNEQHGALQHCKPTASGPGG